MLYAFLSVIFWKQLCLISVMLFSSAVNAGGLQVSSRTVAHTGWSNTLIQEDMLITLFMFFVFNVLGID